MFWWGLAVGGTVVGILYTLIFMAILMRVVRRYESGETTDKKENS